MKSYDPRRPGEGAEHDDDAPILVQVSDRLDATSGLVEIGDLPLSQHDEFLPVALRRAVEKAFPVKGSGRDEEDRLAHEPLPQTFVDALENLAHTPLSRLAPGPPPRAPYRLRRRQSTRITPSAATSGRSRLSTEGPAVPSRSTGSAGADWMVRTDGEHNAY